MRIFLIVPLLIALAVITAIFLHQDPGSVLVTFQDTDYAAPLIHVMYGLIIAFGGLYLLLRIIGMLFRARSSLGKAKNRRAIDAAAQRLLAGSVDLTEGQYERAEKVLIKDVPTGPAGALHYLAAAEAAFSLDKIENLERYLKSAAAHHPGASFGIDLGRAQKSLDAGDAEAALESARTLVRTQVRNPRAMTLLARSLAATGNWQELSTMLPELRKHSSLSKQQVAGLETDVSAALLANADDKQLEACWKSLTAQAKNQPELINYYAKRLQSADKGDVAEKVLRSALSQGLNPSLVATYGAIDGNNADQQLSQLQKWIDEHGEDADLLSAAGQLSVRQELWGKAHSYLEQAAKLQDSANIQHSLAQIADNKGDADASRLHLQRGLSLALGQ